MGCCTVLDQATSAKYYHPDTKQGMCAYAARYMVYQAIERSDTELATLLEKRFGFKKERAYRAEHLFLWELNKMVPSLRDESLFRWIYDKPASTINGGPKRINERRPDYLHIHGEGTNAIALLGEFDERVDHETSINRLREIANAINVPAERIYVYRVNGHEGTDKCLWRERTTKTAKYVELLESGNAMVKAVAAYVRECVEKIRQGIPPSVSPGEISIKYFV